MTDRAIESRAVERPPMVSVGPLVVGVYAWSSAVFLGVVLLDVALARLIVAAGGTAPYSGASDVRDLLLPMAGLVIVAGLAAAASARRSPSVTVLLIAAVGLGLGELLVPALLARPIDDLSATIGIALGPWLRVGAAAAVSILAFGALWRVARAT
jgi:hypothetical protein